MSSTARLALALLGLLIGAIAVIAAVALSGGSDDNGGHTAVSSPTVPGTIVTIATPSPAPTLETAPDATATPVQSAEEQARNFKLIEAPDGLLQFVTDGPYVVPPDGLGIFYLDIETGEIVGWYDLIGGTSPEASSGDNRFAVFERDQQTFQGGVIYPAGAYLADRETRTVYRWAGDAELVYQRWSFNGSDIAARDGLVLFRIPVEGGDDWFSLLDVDSGEVVVTFQAPGEWAIISDDTARIALASGDLVVVDVASGGVERIDEGILPGLDLEGVWGLINSADGDSFIVYTNPAKERFIGVSLRYTWDGELLSQLTGSKIFPSPEGDYVAVAEPLALESESPESASPWYIFSAYDTADGSEVFRVVGVLPHYGFTAGNRWLADGSGFVVERPDYELTLAMRDGSFRDFAGVPSPDSPDVFGVVGGAVEADGTPIIVVSFQGGIRDFADPWGDNGDEVRILIPHGGHGGPGSVATIIEPYVEQAPYAGEPPLQLSEVAVAFGLLDLYDEPAGAVIGQVAAPYRVIVHEVVLRCSGDSRPDSQECPIIDPSLHAGFLALVSGVEVRESPLTGHWARVTTADGQEGWLLLQVNPQGL